ncbi:hypothetical protein [Halobacillus aidingensis]|nr:hypothetical protein [Halobacillus aidingensis]
MKKVVFLLSVLFLSACSSDSDEIKLDTVPEEGNTVYEKTINDKKQVKELQTLIDGLGDRKINEFSSWSGNRKFSFDYSGQSGSIYVKDDDDGGAFYIGEGMHYELDEETLDEIYSILNLNEDKVEK